MTAINSYVTLAEFKGYITARGQSAIAVDSTDDIIIDRIIEASSRAIDGETNRTFYPRVETRYFSVPEPVDSELMLDDDLLAITTLTNGDAVAVGSTDYNLLPRNQYPKYSVKLKDSSDLFWEWDSDGNDEFVISVLGYWGHHNRYTIQPAWVLGTTLAEALDVSELPWDVASSAAFSPGQIIKVDNEICVVDTVASALLTMVARGANGSTAATHTTSTAIYYWSPQRDIWQACMDIAVNSYHRRFGANVSGASTITPAGLVIAPQDWTDTAKKVMERYRRII